MQSKQQASLSGEKVEQEEIPEPEPEIEYIAEAKPKAEVEITDAEEEQESVCEEVTDSEDPESDAESIPEVAKPSLSSRSGSPTVSQKSSSPECVEPPKEATELSDICRNSEGLQFIDHVTEIKPGESLSCYDELIYGESVASSGPVQEADTSKDYEHWQSISPEELFQATSFETKFFNNGGENRNLRRRKRRAFDS